MRDIAILLNLVLDKINNGRYAGLCIVVSELYEELAINESEGWLLQNYINNNKPFNWRTVMYEDFFWKPYNDEPRIKWLEKHIKRNTLK